MLGLSPEKMMTTDYRTLGNAVSMSVLEYPPIVVVLKNIGISNVLKYAEKITEPEYIGAVRCACAYIGLQDPLKSNKGDIKK